MTHEYRDSIEVLVKLLDIFRIVLGRLPLVHCVEVGAGIIGLGPDGLEERSQSVLEAMPSQQSTTQQIEIDERTIWDRFATMGAPLDSFRPP